MNAIESLSYFKVELLITSIIVLFIFLNLWKIKKTIQLLITYLGIIGLGIALLLQYQELTVTRSLFFGIYITDPFSNFFRLIFIITTILVSLIITRSTEVEEKYNGEYYIMLYAVLLAMILLVSSTNLLMLYLSLEFLSIASYLLTGFKRHDRRASEAALKYVIYGGVASGIMLFGISYIYGLTSTLQITEIRDVMLMRIGESGASSFPIRLALLTSVIFVLSGFAYKVAAVPFHMWCPDVYEGAPTPFTAFLSVAPKIAGLVTLIRFVFTGFVVLPGGVSTVGDLPWGNILIVVSIATMTWGNLSAISQHNLKRLLAYSSIAHCGYILMAISTLTREGLSAVYLYAIFYLLMNLGAFFIIIAIREKTGSEEIETYRGLSVREPLLAAAFAIFLFSLTGLPPFAGFIGKFYVFAAVLKMKSFPYYLLAIIGVINSVISLYYYARILKAMYLEKGLSSTPLRIPLLTRGLVTILMFFVLLLGIYWQPLTRLIQTSSTLNGYSLEQVSGLADK